VKRGGGWRANVLAWSLAWISGMLQRRDALSGKTRGLRRHELAEDFFFPCGGRKISAVYVAGEPGVPAVLLCHGIGETVEHWSAVQAVLRGRGVGSLVFNYSGYGRSDGPVRAEHCDQDLIAAYAELRRRVGPELPVFVLGFSLGSGIAAHGVGALRPPVAGLFLCEAFDCFREAACATGVPRLMLWAVADVWDTAAAVRQIELPVCVVHSDADRLFPLAMAQKIVAACGRRGELVVVPGLSHDEPYLRAPVEYWEPIIQRVLESRLR
jgi:alpha-beta hydrolase superfamily lysophospholipase